MTEMQEGSYESAREVSLVVEEMTCRSFEVRRKRRPEEDADSPFGTAPVARLAELQIPSGDVKVKNDR